MAHALFVLGPADQSETIELAGPATDPVVSIAPNRILCQRDLDILNGLFSNDDDVE